VLTAVESVRTLPTNRAVFAHAKIVHVIEGAVDVMTEHGTHHLTPGMALALGEGQWCSMTPVPRVRMWTIYVEEGFLRSQMAWFLPDRSRVLSGLHPHEWDGAPMVLEPGMPTLRQVEPIWRQIAMLNDESNSPEFAAVRAIELFSQWAGIVIPLFLRPDAEHGERLLRHPVRGRLTNSMTIGLVGDAVRLLRQRMGEPWTVKSLAREVALSKTHLTRLFVRQTGISPMRFLSELRLVEFTRMIEETDVSVAYAAKSVGWADPRVASARFSRRFGISPTQYRLNPHLHHLEATPLIEDSAPESMSTTRLSALESRQRGQQRPGRSTAGASGR